MDKLVKHAIRMLEIVEGENDFFRNDEKFVASFDMVTINGWVLIDSTADTPQTDCGWK